jgi:hypothetical protein
MPTENLIAPASPTERHVNATDEAERGDHR